MIFNEEYKVDPDAQEIEEHRKTCWLRDVRVGDVYTVIKPFEEGRFDLEPGEELVIVRFQHDLNRGIQIRCCPVFEIEKDGIYAQLATQYYFFHRHFEINPFAERRTPKIYKENNMPLPK